MESVASTGFGLREHLATVSRHLGTILLVIAGALAVGGAFAFLQTPVYLSEARLLILDRDPVQVVANVSGGDRSVFVTPQEEVLTQVQIVRSPVLAERVAERIGPDLVLAEMTWRWDWLRALPRTIRTQVFNTLARWSPTRALLDQAGLLPKAGPPTPPLVAAREKISANLFAEGISKTDMFVVAFEAPDPVFAARVVNELLAVYMEHLATLRSPLRIAQLAAAEAGRLEQEVSAAETRLKRFIDERDILDLEAQKDLLLTRLSGSQEALSKATSEALEAEQRIAAIRSRTEELPPEAPQTVVTRRNPVADRLIERIAQLEIDAGQYLPGSPAATQLANEIDSVRRQLRGVARSVQESETIGSSTSRQDLQTRLILEQADARALNVRVNQLREQVAALRSEIGRLDGYGVALRELRREAEAKEQALAAALQRREETAIFERVSDAQLSRVVPVGPALAAIAPHRPKRMMTLALAGALGVFGGVGLAYLFEFLRRTVSTREEAQAALGLPVLAALLRVRSGDRERQSNALEFRRIITSLHRLREQHGSVSVLLASARAGEGRTYIANEIADVLRRDGVDVLLVHVAPHGHENAPGTTRATGTAPVSIPALRRETTAMPTTTDGSGLLQSVQVEGLNSEQRHQVSAILDDMRGRSAVVIIDPPALPQCPEQLRIAPRTNAVLFIVEADGTPAVTAQQSIQSMRDADAPLLGLVLNKRKHRIPGWAYRWLLVPARS